MPAGHLDIVIYDPRAYLTDVQRNGGTVEVAVSGARSDLLVILDTVGAVPPAKPIFRAVLDGAARFDAPTEAQRATLTLTDASGFPYDSIEAARGYASAFGEALLGPDDETERGSAETKSTPGTTTVFLSHAGADAVIAERVEAEIRATLPDVQVFRTTRPDQLPTGQGWFQHIEEGLRGAGAYVVLLTPTSVARPWILFEAGAAWFSDQPMVLALCADLHAEDVPEPLRLLQLRDFANQAAVVQAFHELGANIRAPATFVADLQRLSAEHSATAIAHGDLHAVVHQARRFAWDGPLHKFAESDPRAAPDGLVDTLRAADLDVTMTVRERPDAQLAKGYLRLYEITQWNSKHQVLGEHAQVFLVRPKG
jgi:hypothetical protein